MLRTEIWYSIGGFLLVSWLALGVGAAARLGKVQAWFGYACSVLAAAMSMTAGAYAAQDTWIEHLAVALIGLHPVILIIVGLVLVALVVQLVKATVPDQLVAYAMSSTLVIAAFWVPILTEHALPPGQVGDLTSSVSTAVSTAVVDSTGDWFNGQDRTGQDSGGQRSKGGQDR